MSGTAPYPTPTIAAIQETTAEVFGVCVTDMKAERRSVSLARPRQVAMYLSRQLTTRSLPEIGRHFGGRDHTTVMHALKRIDDLAARDPDLAEKIAKVRRRVAHWTEDDEIERLGDLVAERDATIVELKAMLAERDARICSLISRPSRPVQRPGVPKERQCMKCGEPIFSPYPGVCSKCRADNGGASPLAEGVVG